MTKNRPNGITTCSKCGIRPPYTKGVSYCTPCQTQYHKEWLAKSGKVYKQDPVKHRAAVNRWRENNKQAWNAYMRMYRVRQKTTKLSETQLEKT